MSNIVLAFKCAITAASTTWYGDGGSTALAKMADPVFQNKWVYTPGVANNDGLSAKFGFSVSSPLRTNHIAFPAHNLSKASQIRVKMGLARLDIDFTSENPFDTGVVFGGGVGGTRTNEYGVMVAASCPRYEHDRRYPENGFQYSEDLSQASVWTVTGMRYSDGRHLYLPAATGAFGQSHGYSPADTYEVLALCRCKDGDGQLQLMLQGVTSFGVATGPTKTVGTDWQWVSWTCTTPTTEPNTMFSRLIKPAGAAGGLFEFACLQFRRGLSGGKYRKTTTQRRYQRIGLVAEAGATNSLLQSHVYTNAAWTKSATVTAGAGNAPDGTATLSSINGTISAQVVQTITMGGTTTRALSFIFQRGGTATSCDLSITWQTGGVAQAVNCRFNPSTGAFVSKFTSGGAATLIDGGVKDLGGGWFRAYVIGTGTDALNTSLQSGLIWNGNGTVLAWGMQNEANFVTSYIPTTTAAVTRTQDTATVDASFWVPYALNLAEFTLYHEAGHDGLPVNAFTNASTVNVGAAGGNVYSQMVVDTAGAYNSHLQATGGSGGTVLTSDTLVPVGTIMRAAIRARAQDWAQACNGSAVKTNTAIGMPPLSSSPFINLMYGPSTTVYLRRFTLWPFGMVNADIQAISANGPSAVDSDSGWSNALAMVMRGDVAADWGDDYDLIFTSTMRPVEWVRVELYDPTKVSTTDSFQIGRAFIGKTILQPAVNAVFGLSHEWINRTEKDYSVDGRAFFNDKKRLRGTLMGFKYLTPNEAQTIHEMQGSGGIAEEVLFIADPDDLAESQKYGFVGYLKDLDRLTYPLFPIRETEFQLEKKR